MNITTTIQEIAAIYIESAEAGQDFMLSEDREDLERHTELFKAADAEFEALIEADGSYYNCELREIRYAITQRNFNDAKARYAALTN